MLCTLLLTMFFLCLSGSWSSSCMAYRQDQNIKLGFENSMPAAP